ncbi:MAG: VOC family protein [Burkholderiales bacterium]|nr:VOC family protein [Burkholderiales bacterium]
MTSSVASGKSSLIPCLRYRDAPAAIDWLCRNLGFERHLVVQGADGLIPHAQLVHGGGMIMVGSVRGGDGSDYGNFVRQPDEVGGFETQTPYLVVHDADEVYRRVLADGGTIIMEIKDEEYGGRGFGFRDPEGRFWYVGTYDPWVTEPGTP